MTEQTLIIAILVALVILWMATRKTDLTALVGGGKVSAAGWQTLATYGVKKIHSPTKTAAAYRSGCFLFRYSFMRQMRMACFSTLKRTSV